MVPWPPWAQSLWNQSPGHLASLPTQSLALGYPSASLALSAPALSLDLPVPPPSFGPPSPTSPPLLDVQEVLGVWGEPIQLPRLAQAGLGRLKFGLNHYSRSTPELILT